MILYIRVSACLAYFEIGMMKMKKKKLFNIDESVKVCKNCAFGKVLVEEDKVLCEKTGIRNLDSCCKKFRYDPICRVPNKQPELTKFTEEDFAL